MAHRHPARAESTDQVKSHLDEGLKSCSKLLASYREVFAQDRRLFRTGWKS
jgi:hypothetical protein